MKPGDLCLSQDFPHHDQLTPDSAPFFSVLHVGVRVLLNGAVDRLYVFIQEKQIYTYKIYIIIYSAPK